jgi:hypothetical protein
MATKTFNTSKIVISAADAIVVGDPGMTAVGTIAIMLVASTTGTAWTGSITVKARSSAPEAAAETPVAVQYSARYLNGAISTDSLGSAAITGTSLILVPASGQTIVLDCTSYTQGTMTVYKVPLVGAAV